MLFLLVAKAHGRGVPTVARATGVMHDISRGPTAAP